MIFKNSRSRLPHCTYGASNDAPRPVISVADNPTSPLVFRISTDMETGPLHRLSQRRQLKRSRHKYFESWDLFARFGLRVQPSYRCAIHLRTPGRKMDCRIHQNMQACDGSNESRPMQCYGYLSFQGWQLDHSDQICAPGFDDGGTSTSLVRAISGGPMASPR